MTKEKLLERKRELANKLACSLNSELIMTDDMLRCFSLNQLQTLIALTKKAENYNNNNQAFYALSSNEVVQKSTGRIVSFDGNDNGDIMEVDEEWIMNSASRNVYEHYRKKIK